MKNSIFLSFTFTLIPYLLIFFIFVFLSSCKRKYKDTSNIVSRTYIHFLDTINHFNRISLDNAVDSFDFQFVNMSNQPLVILSAKTSCECTIAKYPKIPVMPADTSYIRVIYDGRGRKPEYFNKSVTVVSSASFDEIVLEITGELK